MSSKKTSKERKAEKVAKQRQDQVVYDLFDNPMTRAAMNALDSEQIDKYKKIGEEMYGNIDFTQSKVLNNMPAPMAEALAYIVEGLKAGIHPSDLDKDEMKLLEEGYGEKWYERWGYNEKDLESIETIKK